MRVVTAILAAIAAASLAAIAATSLSALDARRPIPQQQGTPPAGQSQAGTTSPTAQTPLTAAPRRTEAEARAAAERNRRERELQRQKTGAPVELISNYIKANILPVPASLGVSPFYTKYVDLQGIPVISSDKVPDDALLVARDIINSMLAKRPDIRASMVKRRWRTGVIGECFVNERGNVRVDTPEEFEAYDPVLNELISRVFDGHRIPMDVFHGKQQRKVNCGPARAEAANQVSDWRRRAAGSEAPVLRGWSGVREWTVTFARPAIRQRESAYVHRA